MQHYDMLTSIEHPKTSLTFLSMYSDEKYVLCKVVFDPEMRLLDLLIPWTLYASPSCEIEGMVKIQSMEGVEEHQIQVLYG